MTALPKFTGKFEHALDDKGRLTIPARFRARLGDHFVLTIAPPERCLAMYPEAAWSAFCEKLESASSKDARFRSFVRHLFSNTDEVVPDSQGRVLLAAPLREYAGIDRDAVLVGALTRVEIWAPDQWRHTGTAPDGMPDLMAELGLY